MDPKFETTTQQEKAYLDQVHPTPEETPGCAELFDTFISCNGSFIHPLSSNPI
jgi:hypothetical protein